MNPRKFLRRIGGTTDRAADDPRKGDLAAFVGVRASVGPDQGAAPFAVVDSLHTTAAKTV